MTGLAFVHGKDLAHLDVKPSNILLKDEGVAALTDFGISKRLDGQGAVSGGSFYIPHVAPERISSGLQTQATDIYQAGITLYRLCNTMSEWKRQLNPYDDRDSIEQDVMSGEFPDRERFLPHIPRKLRSVVRKAIQVQPDDRYKSVRAMMNELGSVSRYLDWRMEVNGSKTNNESWEMEDPNGRRFRIEVCATGNDWSVETTKTVSQPRKVRNCCADSLATREKAHARVKRFIRSDDLNIN